MRANVADTILCPGPATSMPSCVRTKIVIALAHRKKMTIVACNPPAARHLLPPPLSCGGAIRPAVRPRTSLDSTHYVAPITLPAPPAFIAANPLTHARRLNGNPVLGFRSKTPHHRGAAACRPAGQARWRAWRLARSGSACAHPLRADTAALGRAALTVTAWTPASGKKKQRGLCPKTPSTSTVVPNAVRI